MGVRFSHPLLTKRSEILNIQGFWLFSFSR
nr:MAG TPA: Nucleosome assembly protein [Caudoviricetes sp.]